MLSFYHLLEACRFGPPIRFCQQMQAWSTKRQALHVQLRDLPTLIEAWRNTRKWVDPKSPKVTQLDPIPGLRLTNAFESTAHGLYALAEVAADVANKITKKTPRGFNSLQKAVAAGKTDPELVGALGDLQWYRKIREMRTEWTHYTTVFIGKTDDPEILIHGYREKAQRVELGDRSVCTMDQFIEWMSRAFATTDGLAIYLLQHHVLPQYDLDLMISGYERDENGFPRIREDHSLVPRQVSVRDLLGEMGLMEGRDWTPRAKTS